MIPGIVSWNPVGGVTTDPYFSNVTLLLHCNGADGSTTITDNSPSPKALTVNGNAKISTAQSKFDGASANFDGDGDFITSPANAGFDFPGDFTIEFFVYLSAYSPQWAEAGYGFDIISTYVGATFPRGWQVRINGTASSFTTVNVYTGTNDLNFSAAFSLNTWYHVAVSRVSGQLRAFVDGVQVGSTITNSDDFGGSAASSKPLYIGGLNDATYKLYFNGFLDEVRLTKGVGRYTADFTPPSAPFPDS